MSTDSKKQLPQTAKTESTLFKKSNVFISAQFKWGSFATSILNLALTKMIKGEAMEDEYGVPRMLVIHMYEMPGFKSGNSNTYIYKKVDKASDELQNAKINIQYTDANGKTAFEKIVVFPYAHYADGKLTLAFDSKIISRQWANPLENYTKILLTGELFGNSESATKLYENLKKHCYYRYRVEDHYEWTVTVPTLRCLLGTINMNQKEFQTAMEKFGEKYDVDAVVEELEKKDRELLKKRQEEENAKYGEHALKVKLGKTEFKAPYADYRDFRRGILDPAVKMINEKVDLKVTYTSEHLSAGGKINSIKFFIYDQTKIKDMSFEERRKRIIEVAGILTGTDIMDWTTDMIGDLLSIADYDVELVKEKYRFLQSQKPDSVKNRYGWMKAAIDEDYKKTQYVDEPQLEKEVFDRLWDEYPKKSRMDRITKRQKLKINREIGYDKIHKALVNYMNFIENQRKGGFNRAYLGGGMFFAGEYERWTDENIDETVKEENRIQRPKNKFVNFEQDEVDYDCLAKKKVMQRMLDSENNN